MGKWLNAEIALGFVIATIFWVGVLGWQASYAPTEVEKQHCYESAQKSGHKAEECKSLWEKATTDPVAFFTLWLVISTVGLGVSTVLLWRDTKRSGERQARDTEILQRAYLSVTPLGLVPFRREPLHSLIVGFHNSGNLPAREVRWHINREADESPIRQHFPIGSNFEGSLVIPQGVTAPKGSLGFETETLNEFYREGTGRNRWLYVWGEVRYLDGFGVKRHTRFCHRYNLAAFREGGIPARDARHHEYGNDAT